MRQSLNIIQQVLNLIPGGFVTSHNKFSQKTSMEKVINHFKQYSSGLKVGNGTAPLYIEAPKGEFGVFLVTNNSNKPYRCKILSPGFKHLQGMNLLAYNHYISDVVTIIGTQDIVFGEVDR